MMKKKDPLRQFEINRLANGTDNVIKDHSLSEGFKNGGKVGGLSNVVDNAVQPVLSGSDHMKKIQALLKGGAGKKMMAGIPVLGGLAQALSSQDVLAAIDPTDSEDVGLGSDRVDPLQNEEALLNVAPENFADRDVADQARRWQKLRGMFPQE